MCGEVHGAQADADAEVGEVPAVARVGFQGLTGPENSGGAATSSTPSALVARPRRSIEMIGLGRRLDRDRAAALALAGVLAGAAVVAALAAALALAGVLALAVVLRLGRGAAALALAGVLAGAAVVAALAAALALARVMPLQTCLSDEACALSFFSSPADDFLPSPLEASFGSADSRREPARTPATARPIACTFRSPFFIHLSFRSRLGVPPDSTAAGMAAGDSFAFSGSGSTFGDEAAANSMPRPPDPHPRSPSLPVPRVVRFPATAGSPTRSDAGAAPRVRRRDAPRT